MKLKHACVDAGQYGVNVSPDEYRSSGIRMLRTSDLSDAGVSSPEDGVYLKGPIPPDQLLQEGDLLLSRAGTIGRSYLVPRAAVGDTFAGFLVRFRPSATTDARFLSYALRTKVIQDQITAEAVSSTIQNFNADRYANLVLPDVASEEQRRIAEFLDDRGARIDQIIAAQRKQIDNLLEWIASAVDGLLAPQQGAGRWLRVKDVSSKVGSGKTPRGGADAYVDEGVAFLRSQNVHNDGLRLNDVAFISAEIDEEMSSTRVREGDVLLNITGGSLGRCCAVDGLALPANVSQHVCIIRPTAINPSHLALLLRSKVVQDQIRLGQVGGNRDGLNFGQVRELRFWHPADAMVWSRCGYWETQGTEGVAMIGRAVSLLQSYREALITAAVMGELDVTTAGSGIPG